jgi:hypothetical protein
MLFGGIWACFVKEVMFKSTIKGELFSVVPLEEERVEQVGWSRYTCMMHQGYQYRWYHYRRRCGEEFQG